MNTEEQFDYLRAIKDNPELRAEIEQFILENDFDPKDYSKTDMLLLKQDIARALTAMCIEWTSHYEISYFSIYLYFSLDKKLLPKIKNALTRSQNKSLEIYHNGYWHCINAALLPKIFKRNNKELIQVIYENIELFPHSTQEYVEKELSEIGKWCVINKITNDFEYKAVKHKMNPEFNFHNLNSNIDQFIKLDNFNRSSSFFYYYILLHEAYEDLNSFKQTDAILSRLIRLVGGSLNAAFIKFNHNEEHRVNLLKLFLNKFKKHPFLLDDLIQLVKRDKHIFNRNTINFLYFCTTDNNHITILDNAYLGLIGDEELLKCNKKEDVKFHRASILIANYKEYWKKQNIDLLSKADIT